MKSAPSLVLMLTALILAAAASAAPGDLDTTFGSGGKVTTSIGSSNETGLSVMIQADGKVVVAGETYNGSNWDFALTRYTSNGTLDSSFGTGGKVTMTIGTSDESAKSVVVQSDGRILVAGFTNSGSGSGTFEDFALIRFNVNGTLDASFGNGGKVVTDIGNSSNYGNAAALQRDGKILVVGSAYTGGSNYDIAVARYNADGSLDTTFGVGGKVTTAIGTGDDEGTCVAVQNDGKIVVAGQSWTSGNKDFALVRYDSDGLLDPTFGSGGKMTLSVGSEDDLCNGLVLQNDGRIVVAGEYVINPFLAESGSALARFNTNGTVDTTFGNGGKVTTNVSGTSHDGYRGVLVMSDGRILAEGYSYSTGGNYDFALARYNASGALDSSFGSGGTKTTDFGSTSEEAYGMALQNDGKILLAGYYRSGNNRDFAIARYEGFTTTTTNQPGSVNTNLSVAPTAGAAEIYNNGGNNITNPNWTSVGTSGVGVMNFSGGAFSPPALYVGEFGGSQGTLNVSAGTVSSSGTQSVGHAGAGTFYQTGGSNSGQNLYLGFSTTGRGTYILTASTLTVTNSTVIGYAGTGSFLQNGGTFTANGNAIELADQAGAYGSYQMSAGALNSTQTLHVGYAGQGVFNQTGGDVSVAFVRLGTVAGATGLYQLSGTGTVTTTSNLGVGFAASGTFTQSAGTVNVGGILSVGRAANGTMIQSGGTSTATGGMFVGEQSGGTGTYTLSAGTLMINGHSHVGFNGTGTLTVSGGSVNLGTTKDLYFGTNATGTGTLNANGGTITGRDLAIADNATSTGTVNINGGTLNFTNIRTGAGSKTIVFNKGTVNATGTAISPGAGGLVVGDGTNAATLNLGNGSHTISNGVRINPAATLSLASSNLGGLLVALQGGKITGNGTVGTFTATSGSVIDLGGSSASTLTTTGNVTLASGVSYNVDLVSGPASDQINVSGTVDLASAFLNITLRFAPSIGQVFTIVQNDGTDAVTGTFNGKAQDSIHTLTNVGVGGGTYKAQISYTGGSGNEVVLRIVDAPVVTLAAISSVTPSSVTLNGTVNPQGAPTTAQFEYGLTASYGSTASVTLSPNNGTTAQNVSANLTGLTPGTTYHYRLTASNAAGTATAAGTFNTALSNNANLSNLTASAGAFTVPFGANTTYLVMAPYTTTSTTITPTVAASGATVKVNGVTVASGTASGAIQLGLGDNSAISVVCTAPDGVTTQTYEVIVSRAYPAIGSLDVGYGTGGVVNTGNIVNGTEGNDLDMILQPDGRTVITTTSNFGGSSEYAVLLRRNTDGSASFSHLGTSVTQSVYSLGVCVDAGGKLCVVGAESGNAVLLRYTTSGVLDATFDTDGKVVTDFGGVSDEAIGVAVQGDGKIVVCGTNGADFIIARYLSTGALDTTFGIAGKVTTDFGGSETANNIIVLSDGKILVSGDCEPGGTSGFVVARYLTNGMLDSTFGTAGKVVTPSIGGENGCACAMALQEDGKLIVGGRDVNANICFAMVRYLANGTVDTSFGSNGFVRTTFGLNSFTEGNDIAIGPDGRIVIAGTATVGGFSQFAMARYLPDGTLDTSFDGDGLLTTNFNSTDAYIASIKLQADGKIVAAGNVRGADGHYSAVVVRYNNISAPTVTTQGATDVTSTSATLNGTVNANGNVVVPSFRISTDQVNWSLAGADQTLISGTTPQGITRTTLAGLTPGTLYYVQAQAELGDYHVTGLGNVMTFSTVGNYTIERVVVGKSISYTQTSATSVGVNPEPPGSTPDYGGAYGFSVNVEGAGIDALGAAPVVTGPFQSFHLSDAPATHNGGALLYSSQDAMWRYGSPNANDWGSPSLADLDARFGSGTYTVTVGGVSVPLSLTGDLYPNTPQVTLGGGVWLGGKYYISPNAILTVATNTFAGYGSHADDTINSGIDGITTHDVFASTSPVTNSLGYQVPAGTLVAGQEYLGRVSFAALSDVNHAVLPGSLNVAFYQKETQFNVVVTSTLPAIGSPDENFGSSGIASHAHSGTEGNDADMFLQDDGKVVFVTTSNFGGNANNVLLLRRNTDGSVDYTSTGTATTEGAYALGICADASGRPLVVGSQAGDAVLLRYSTSGVLDGTFDSDGKVTTDFGGGSDEAIGVAVQSDGKIVVCGGNGTDFVIARYLNTGAIDSTFGLAGKVTTDFGGTETANNVIILSDGMILVSGDREGAGGGHVVARYLPNGTLDASFGTAGKVLNTNAGGENGCAWAMAMQSDGRFIVGGRSAGTDCSFEMVRYLPNGSVDTSFGASGIARRTFGAGSATEGNDIVIGVDGHILIAGTATVGGFNQFAMARFLTDGTPDPAFDGDGLLTTNFNSSDAYIASVKLQPDGQIVAAGNVRGADGHYSAVVVRYNNIPAPTVVTLPESNVTSTTAILHGTVDANGGTATPAFFISTDQVSWMYIAPEQLIISGTSIQSINATANNLTPGTRYYILAYAEETNYDLFSEGEILSFVTPAPEIAVEDAFATSLEDGASSVQFGTAVVGQGMDRHITIRNTGGADLLIGNVIPGPYIDGVNASQFTLLEAPVSFAAIHPGQSLTFTVRYTPLSGAPESAVLHIESNDADEPSFDINLSATLMSLGQYWRLQYFGTTSNTGNAADNADPDHDGLANLIERGCTLDPTRPSGLPASLARNGGNLEFTYTRSKNEADVGTQFTVEWSDALPGTTWSTAGVTEQVLSNNGTTQQVRATIPAGSNGRRFVHLKVTTPP
ncbi:MAG: cadherin-like beta sandwich domain-containing protein [Prosthecobacter sp.]|uniref:beta strand repeat-containing protein n=1 Tax=Prosthecobacter sp. TaxID=1965333 RepID=UPI0019EC6A30|nr:cadherin-like beta sandwich domain-containing protein [Prosthecobacter sp.]MBE2283891.1 cadherin-like beta sandwich domain-containing protein [Prosthecobacter sp.]